MQPSRQPLMARSWRARCDRRRVVPPECQRRHQLGASGDRASPPHRSRGPRHRSGHAAGRTACRKGARRDPRAPGAVADVPQGDVAAAGRAAAADGRRAARIRSRRGASGVAGAARLRRPARRAVPRCPDGRGIPDRRRGFRGELRHRRRIAGRVGVDPAPAQAGRPHAGAVHVGDGKPCRTSHPASAQVGAGRRRHGLRTVGARRSAARDVVAGRQADRRVRRPARAGEARRAARCAGARATTFSWSSSATASTETSSKAPCRQPFSPVRCTAKSSPPATPAWTSSSTPANTRRSARPCRRRWRQACRSSRPNAGGPRDLVAPIPHRVAAAGRRIRSASSPNPSTT